MKNLVEYWRSDALKINMGDYVIEAILDKLGYEFRMFSVARRDGTLGGYSRCLFGVGTLLDSYWFNRVGMHKDVWSCGYGGQLNFKLSDYEGSCTVHAVRGPMTRDHLRLPEDTPLGDSALLLPHLHPIRNTGKGGVIYVPHFESRDGLPRDTLESIGAERLVDICCLREEFASRLEAIVTAGFVLTSSLHGAIFAQAYGVPWALCCPPGSKHNMPFKWEDWCAYLGVKLRFCRHLDDAVAWWDNEGSKGTVKDLTPMMKAFPWGEIAI